MAGLRRFTTVLSFLAAAASGCAGENGDDSTASGGSALTAGLSPTDGSGSILEGSTGSADPTSGGEAGDSATNVDSGASLTSSPGNDEGSGGIAATGGGASQGPATAAASTDTGDGGSTSGGDPVELDCDAPMPADGEQPHMGNGRDGEGNLAWEIWSNTGEGELITYDVPAFSAIWNEAGGYLGRLGYEWSRFGETPVPHEQIGTITADFVSRKMGTAGIYSYVGMYGWSTDPCVEWYVVEDSFNQMPINPGDTTNMGEVSIDGGTYIMYTRPTTGTGGTRCTGENEWIQYYSVRTTARACGRISLTEHFEAWDSLGMPLGNLLEAKILVEVGGGTGRVDLPVANVMVSP